MSTALRGLLLAVGVINPTPPCIPGRCSLHLPGSTPQPDALLNVKSQQPMGLGQPRVDAKLAVFEADLSRLLHSEPPEVFPYPAPMHGV